MGGAPHQAAPLSHMHDGKCERHQEQSGWSKRYEAARPASVAGSLPFRRKTKNQGKAFCFVIMLQWIVAPQSLFSDSTNTHTYTVTALAFCSLSLSSTHTLISETHQSEFDAIWALNRTKYTKSIKSFKL